MTAERLLADAWDRCVDAFEAISSERRQSGYLWSAFVNGVRRDNPYRAAAEGRAEGH